MRWVSISHWFEWAAIFVYSIQFYNTFMVQTIQMSVFYLLPGYTTRSHCHLNTETPFSFLQCTAAANRTNNNLTTERLYLVSDGNKTACTLLAEHAFLSLILPVIGRFLLLIFLGYSYSGLSHICAEVWTAMESILAKVKYIHQLLTIWFMIWKDTDIYAVTV